ncbi:tetraacyldisaccharide 4'-kinase [Lacihabitans sp. LS3-19]|uniref:tetraacyldisaccharide 4'-kinase n=1 Tax=Lacihabitans sp. LS3-19 TaxID=2487335 RepID=UPI0020CCEF18|nr:tetraacyldisaccharide 4'-kinase [Lacihabitans sp. LS3-19]MCP9769987.1 tetraacyldisaccharide 4'-kinase [Lacihabitans sp. LS3-19]
MLKIFRYFLFPFAILYKSITSIRNLLFDLNILSVFEPIVPTIGIGNLTVGGTGKTPMVDFLMQMFEDYNTATISRGYGRKTKGFIQISKNNSPESVGDEPFMLFNKHSKKHFFVSENRVEGYKKSIEKYPEINLFIFDDVFQHRYLKPTINILLCDYNKPFFKDFVLPMGNLREIRSSAKRANIIVVTKCPQKISENEKAFYNTEIRKYSKSNSPIFFANFKSEIPRNNKNETLKENENIVLVSALADNEAFKNSLSKKYKILEHFKFKDHHTFSKVEIRTILDKYLVTKIVCSEKDFVKISYLINLEEMSSFYIASQQVIFFNESDFRDCIFGLLKKPI